MRHKIFIGDFVLLFVTGLLIVYVAIFAIPHYLKPSLEKYTAGLETIFYDSYKTDPNIDDIEEYAHDFATCVAKDTYENVSVSTVKTLIKNEPNSSFDKDDERLLKIVTEHCGETMSDNIDDYIKGN